MKKPSISSFKKFLSFVIGAGLLGSLSANAWAQVTTPSANVPAQATVLAPLSITSTTTLNFGSFITDAKTAGTVIVPPTGPRTATGGVKLSLAGATAAPTSVTVLGAEGTTISVNLPDTSSSGGIDLVLSGNKMSMAEFTTNLAKLTAIPVSGSLTFQVGATLSVGAAQAAGVYSGQFPITITYN